MQTLASVATTMERDLNHAVVISAGECTFTPIDDTQLNAMLQDGKTFTGQDLQQSIC